MPARQIERSGKKKSWKGSKESKLQWFGSEASFELVFPLSDGGKYGGVVMFARVNTVFGVRENARVVPEEAIVPQGGRQFVIKLLEGPNEQTRTTKRVEVKVGLRSPGKVEILEGLEAGDTVVAAGQQRVQRDGTLVTVLDLAANASARAGNAGNGKSAAPAAGASTPAAAPAAANAPAAPVKAAAAEPAAQAPLSGPNPCGVVVSEAPRGLVPVRSVTPAERSPSGPPARDPT